MRSAPRRRVFIGHKMQIQTKGMEAGGAGTQKSSCSSVDYCCK